MAKKGKPTARRSGPYINAAFFCENPIEDKDGAISIIKIYDRTDAELPAAFKDGDSILLNTWFFAAVKAGDAIGSHRIRLVLVAPNGKKAVVSEADFVLLGEENGSNLRAWISFPIQVDGLYWINVEVDGKTLTRSPLRVVLKKSSEPGAGSPTLGKPPARR